MEKNDVRNMTDEEFIKEHSKLVHYVIQKRYSSRLQSIKMNTNLDYDDLVQIGMVGLLKARNRFNPNISQSFSTYAIPTILGEIKKCIRDNSKVRIPRSLRDLHAKLYKEGLFDYTPEEIAQKFGVSFKLAKDALNFQETYASMDAAIYKDDKEGDEITLSETLQDPENMEEEAIKRSILNDFISTLKERERKIWEFIKQGKTQQEIARLLGISQAQISRDIKAIYRKAQMYGKKTRLSTC